MKTILLLSIMSVIFISGCTTDGRTEGMSDNAYGSSIKAPITDDTSSNIENSNYPVKPLTEQTQEPYQTQQETANDCKGTKTKFDFAPVNLEKTKVFLPLGLMTGSHVTPIDHHYFQDFDNEGYDIEIYSPGDGYITDVGHMPGAKSGEDYRVVIEHTCTISSTYIHLGTFAEKFRPYAPENYARLRIPVKAGELIGYYEKNVDYNLVDEEVTLTGFANPESYRAEPWKIHVPNTYEYFNEPVKSKLIGITLRTTEPISGKIDYDIDSKLVGNWFLEGTGGYSGESTSRTGYWLNHLAIAYDAYDPERIVFSIGNYEDQDSRQFAVKGNAPDPASIGVEDGLVKYELVEYDWYMLDGNPWDRISPANGIITKPFDIAQGVVLVQMTGPRKIKFEVFPGKTASQINGFTEGAKIYER
ncbi:MAG: hypothetical protein HY513_04725 [Candidatus Aenigmarchaeota archaeon]|nr:hypothetical protein [Candidatus Aenigmarchaeota archaeon]